MVADLQIWVEEITKPLDPQATLKSYFWFVPFLVKNASYTFKGVPHQE